MAIPHAEKLVERAQSGERLTSKERRHCVAYLMATQPEQTNTAIGELFQVSERQIRTDKRVVREERAKLIKEDDIGLVVADIAMTLDRQMRDVESSKKKCRVGSRDYVLHCTTIHDIQLKTVKALQDLGYYPKNLGNMTVEKYEYKAFVTKDNRVDTRPLNMIIEDGLEVQEADFEDVTPKQLPPPPEPVDKQ